MTELFEKARGKLSEVTEDGERYKGILKNLVLEGAYCLNEEKLSVEVREKDVGLVKEVLGEVESTYKEATGKGLKVEVDEQNCLPAESYVYPFSALEQIELLLTRWAELVEW